MAAPSQTMIPPGFPVEDPADWTCAECGEPADLNTGQFSYVLYGGDRDCEIWGTRCCGAEFIAQDGMAYQGDSPRAEVD